MFQPPLKMKLLICVVALVIAGTQGKMCPDYQSDIVSDFDINSYIGAWYEIYRLPAPFEFDSKCVNAFYTLEESPKGPYIQVNNSEQFRGEVSHRIGYAVQPDPTADMGSLYVTFNSTYYPLDVTPNYNVLNTDYTTYSLVYTCRQVSANEIVQFSWILSRTPTLSASVTAPLFAEMESLGVAESQYHQTSQQNCKQYGEQ